MDAHDLILNIIRASGVIVLSAIIIVGIFVAAIWATGSQFLYGNRDNEYLWPSPHEEPKEPLKLKRRPKAKSE